MKIAFAGLRHSHIYLMYQDALADSDLEVIGAWDDDPIAREEAAAAGLNVCFDTYEELLSAPGLEAVAFGGCYGDRGAMIIQAMEAGKHIMADKPVCTSLEELDRIEVLSREKGLKVGCALTLRYSPLTVTAKKLIESGALGEIQSVYMGGQHPYRAVGRPKWYYDPKKHGGTINDIGIHSIDLTRFLTGYGLKEINSARCWCTRPEVAPNFKESGQFMITLENNAGMLGDMSYHVPDSFGFQFPLYWRINVWGVKGMLEYYYNSTQVTFYENGKTEPQYFDGIQPDSNYFHDFVKDVQGLPSPLDTAEVLRTQREILMIQSSAK